MLLILSTNSEFIQREVGSLFTERMESCYTKLRDGNMHDDREPEVWKPILIMKDCMKVFMGRVKSLERIVNMSLVGPGSLKERILVIKKTRLF
jgi:hypothetical protein